jgi:hypothetical protein
MRRNSVEPKNLIEAEAEKISQRGTHLTGGIGLARDERIE